MSVFSGPEIVNDGLVLNLDAANTRSYPGSGTAWNDLSGVGNNATLADAPTFSNGSFLFNGTTNLITIGASNSFNFGTSDFTIEVWCWINSTASPTRGDSLKTVTLFDCGASTANVTSFAVGGSAATPGTSIEYYQTTPAVGVNLAYTITTNAWHNVVWQRSSTALNGFVDSVKLTAGSISAGTAMGGNYQAYIGQSKFSTFKNQFKGYISTVKLYNRALSSIEISQNFEASRGRYGI